MFLVRAYKSPLMMLISLPESVSVNDLIVSFSILLYNAAHKAFLKLTDNAKPVIKYCYLFKVAQAIIIENMTI